jgi:hypothetical protein
MRELRITRRPTQKEIDAHVAEGYRHHIPAIVHRTGGPSAQEDNRCLICGARIGRDDQGAWVAVEEESCSGSR